MNLDGAGAGHRPDGEGRAANLNVGKAGGDQDGVALGGDQIVRPVQWIAPTDSIVGAGPGDGHGLSLVGARVHDGVKNARIAGEVDIWAGQRRGVDGGVAADVDAGRGGLELKITRGGIHKLRVGVDIAAGGGKDRVGNIAESK